MVRYVGKTRLSVAVALVCGPVVQDAWSQQLLEEIIVTASRRSVDLQEVPLAVTALTADMLVDQNIENLQDITAVIPNVLIRGGGGAGANAATINMRGIPGVGTYVDGIWQVSSAGLLQRPFVELDRIEVLRGPQGTLYGRDSTGGSIHLYTEAPQDEFGGNVSMSLGSFDRRDLNANVDLPISETVRTKWSFANFERDGFIQSQVSGRDYGGFEDVVLRGDILWEPTDRFNARLTYQDDEIDALNARVTNFIYHDVAWEDGTQVGVAEMHDIASGGRFNQLSAQSGFGTLGEFENRARWATPTRQDLEQTTLTLNYQVTDALSLKYLYGGTEVLNADMVDFGGNEFNFFLDYNINRIELDSHEIQFSGDHDRIHWSAGYYTWEQRDRFRGTDYAAAEWVQTADQGVPKTLDYQDVLASPACQATAADKGLDFEGRVRFDGSIVGPADSPGGGSWVIPCNGYLGNGLLDAQAIFLTSGDVGSEDRQDGEAWFGEITYDITDRLDMTIGARYHEQTNESYQVDVLGALASGAAEPAPASAYGEYASYDWALGGNILATGPGSLSDPTSVNTWDATTYRFGMSYDVRDDLMVYVAYNEGFNSGGTSDFFDSQGNLIINAYDPETIENFEVGMRGDFFDNRVRLNATVFSTDWLGVHINAQAIDPITGSVLTAVTTQNAASGKAEGVDIELTYSPTDSLVLNANLGFLDTGYTEVQSGLTEAYDLDTTFTGAPDETYNFAVQYTWDFANGGSLMARTSYSYTGFYERSSLLSFRQRTIVPDRDPEAGDFWNLAFRAVYTPASGNYDISVYGNNLTNEYNLNSGFMHRFWNFDFGTVDTPREVGMTFRMSF